MYETAFQITKKTGNNAFSFSKRKNPVITVPSIINGAVNDIAIGNTVAFEDFDEKGHLKSCRGLKNLIRTIHPVTKKPVIIVDNHNHVFYFWYEARNNKQIKDGATLVHIDQHKDSRKPKRRLMKSVSDDLRKVFEYTNEVLNVGNYIPPAIEEGLIGEMISITSEAELKSKRHAQPEPKDSLGKGSPLGRDTHHDLAVNIDLDFWAPEMDYIDSGLKIATAKKWMEKADLITIATSPFFMDQELAIKILKELLK